MVSLVALPAVTSLGLMSGRCKAVFSWVVEPKLGGCCSRTITRRLQWARHRF